MKHFFILMMALFGLLIISSSTTTSSCINSENPTGQVVCERVGNVTAELVSKGGGSYIVKFINSNNYRVTVTWSVVGYNSSGREMRVAASQISVDSGSYQLSHKFDTSGYTGLSIIMTVERCR